MSEITPNTPNPVREDAYVEELAEKLGIDPQYIPKSPVWRNEEEIRAIAEMFANMAGALVVHDAEGTLDKTWQEIHDAVLSRGAVVQVSEDEIGIVTIAGVEAGDKYDVITSFGDIYLTETKSGYPVLKE